MADADFEALMREACRLDDRGQWDAAVKLYEQVAASDSEHASHAKNNLQRIIEVQNCSAEIHLVKGVLQLWDFLALAVGPALVAWAGIAAIMPTAMPPRVLVGTALNYGVWLCLISVAGGIIWLVRHRSSKFPFRQCMRYTLLFSMPSLIHLFGEPDQWIEVRMAKRFDASHAFLSETDLECVLQLLSHTENFDQQAAALCTAYLDESLPAENRLATMESCRNAMAVATGAIRGCTTNVADAGARYVAGEIGEVYEGLDKSVDLILAAVVAGDPVAAERAFAKLQREYEKWQVRRAEMMRK
jgi:hypothetical protein